MKSGIVNNIPKVDFRELYTEFDIPVVPLDCGKMCAPHNPGGKPICCDICHAVPSAYHQEWDYLRPNTDLWHVWRGDECRENPEDPTEFDADTPDLFLRCNDARRVVCRATRRQVRGEQVNLFDRAHHPRGIDEVAHPEGPEA